jgi:NAD(P)-dependent dehydrogenase (short-subunit alcohol dehydrogenase family)
MPRIPDSARVVITGAGSGFGRALALELASRKARLLLSDIDESAVIETCELARRQGAEAFSMIVDVRDSTRVEAMSKRTLELWDGVDVLANNAGVAVAGSIGEVPLADWKWQIDINLWGVIHGCHYFAPIMKTQKRGWILNVASIAGIVCPPTLAPYNVTKAGVIALSETLATELSRFDIVVTALCPSFFRTNIHKNARSPAHLGAQTEKLITESRWSAEEIAKFAIRGLERGDLYVLPQRDAKAMWRMKRALGDRFFDAVGALTKGNYLDRIAALVTRVRPG